MDNKLIKKTKLFEKEESVFGLQKCEKLSPGKSS